MRPFEFILIFGLTYAFGYFVTALVLRVTL